MGQVWESSARIGPGPIWAPKIQMGLAEVSWLAHLSSQLIGPPTTFIYSLVHELSFDLGPSPTLFSLSP